MSSDKIGFCLQVKHQKRIKTTFCIFYFLELWLLGLSKRLGRSELGKSSLGNLITPISYWVSCKLFTLLFSNAFSVCPQSIIFWFLSSTYLQHILLTYLNWLNASFFFFCTYSGSSFFLKCPILLSIFLPTIC